MQMTLKVPKIHCDGCVSTVESAVRRLAGVQDVSASELSKEVRIEFDPQQVREEEIRKALLLVGYPPA
ncbi:MAG: heavy-metal-associated domain-containing protein [Armatimonadetes bacterium]|nr:heavy-metal-associated domain-containing protein [Armatimonadota bacterium]MBI2247251.1 heavy-metal-associated domain-containing protein [Armatimonadota bacterium]MBI2972425.1 heavy-metal-associated domain-containing protein [Armatimonadota bacterium]